MAKYQVAFSCGHTEERNLIGKDVDRQRFIAWAGRVGGCSVCNKANRLAAVQAVEVELDLPALTGTDKQIAWARDLRVSKVKDVLDLIEHKVKQVPNERQVEFQEAMAAAMQVLFGRPAAKFWIEARETDAARLLQAAHTEARA